MATGERRPQRDVHDNFDSVAALDTEAQRQLLRSGDPVEKVWAGWALGLKLGPGVVPELVSALGASPPGTRRHLLVMLAGLGERELLRDAAEGDPDPLVRGTACLYLIRTARPRDEKTERFLLERLGKEHETVRQVILLAAGNKFPGLNRKREADSG